MLKYSSKEAEQSYLSNFSSSAVLSDPASTSNNSSSKAVLAALRALQDKIRRLEAERAQAVEESSQLKHQLKLQEIEFDHSRQKESLSSQKVLQEAKNSFEKVFTEKTDLEVRLVKLEERNKSAQRESEDLQSKIRLLEDEKHAISSKLRDFEFLQQQLDLQIKSNQQKEKDLAQMMVWEAKKHEEELGSLQHRVHSLQSELNEISRAKTTSESKVLEFDQLVTQLLSVNESLVQQLSGKVMMRETVSSANRKKVGSAKKVRSTSTDGRARPQADLTHVAQASKKLTAQSVAVRTSDLDQLKSMHKMYVNIARSISKKDKLSKKAAGKSSRASSPQHSHKGDGSGSIGRPDSADTIRSTSVTRVGRKKEKAKLESNTNNNNNHNNASSSSNNNSTIYNPYSNNNHLIFNDSPSISQEIRMPDVRIPKAVSLDDSSALHMDYDEYLSGKDRSYANLTDYRDQSSTYNNNKTASANSFLLKSQQSNNEHQSFSSAIDMSNATRHYPNLSEQGGHHSNNNNNNNAELQSVISSLEEEFEALNSQYRSLLASSNNYLSNSNPNLPSDSDGQPIDYNGTISGRHLNLDESGQVAARQMQSQADEIVRVIQKLHQKGEQLRALKSPLR